jgi:predicted DsbA family dithiol-disulfide isomerase
MEPAQVERVQQHMQKLASGEGIRLKYGGKTGSSRLSHQLLDLAKTKGLKIQWDIAQEIFRVHFEEDGDITDIELLVAAGVRCGLDEQEVRTWLSDKESAKIVDNQVEEIRAKGVNGVPRFLIQDGKHQVEGAGDLEDFFEIFMKIKADESSSSISTGGTSC